MSFLVLRPLPMSPDARHLASAELAEQLKGRTFDEIVAEHVAGFYAVEPGDSAIPRRMRKNFSLAYTREELEQSVRAHLRRLLPTASPDGGRD